MPRKVFGALFLLSLATMAYIPPNPSQVCLHKKDGAKCQAFNGSKWVRGRCVSKKYNGQTKRMCLSKSKAERPKKQ